MFVDTGCSIDNGIGWRDIPGEAKTLEMRKMAKESGREYVEHDSAEARSSCRKHLEINLFPKISQFRGYPGQSGGFLF